MQDSSTPRLDLDTSEPGTGGQTRLLKKPRGKWDTGVNNWGDETGQEQQNKTK